MIDKLHNIQSLGVNHLKRVTSDKINELINYQKPITLVDSSEGIKWNMRKGYNTQVTLAGNRTISFQELTPGDYGTLKIIQDNVGSRTLTLPSNSIVMGTGGTSTLTLSSAANAIDIASIYYDGTTIFWNISLY